MPRPAVDPHVDRGKPLQRGVADALTSARWATLATIGSACAPQRPRDGAKFGTRRRKDRDGAFWQPAAKAAPMPELAPGDDDVTGDSGTHAGQ